MDNQRQGFLHALSINEDDVAARNAYSDWLEENGEYEEAERQRKWRQAKAFIMSLLTPPSSLDHDDVYDDDYLMDYQTLMVIAFEAFVANEREPSFSCRSDMDLTEKLRANREAFWKNWSIVTGISLPVDFESGYFSCGC